MGHACYSETSVNIEYGPAGGLYCSAKNEHYELGVGIVSTVPVGIWTRVAVAYDQKIGIWVYINGVLERFKSISLANPFTKLWDVPSFIGTKTGQYCYRYAGVLDEIKFFYKGLNSASE